MNDLSEMARQLEEAQALLNNGRGVTCVRSMVTYLNRGDLRSAQYIRQNEGDKTRMYPELEQTLEKLFGCRLHLTHGCDRWICNPGQRCP